MSDQGFPWVDQPFVSPERRITTSWYRLLLTLWNRTGGANGTVGTPSGAVAYWAGSGTPDGYLWCDGAAVSRTTYANLFANIGTTFGPGDGVTTFNVPDLQGRFMRGAGGSISVGDTGGADTVTLTVNELPTHDHAIDTDDFHHHASVVEASNVTAGTDPGGVVPGDTGDSSANITETEDSGLGQPFSILPPWTALRYIIKT